MKTTLLYVAAAASGFIIGALLQHLTQNIAASVIFALSTMIYGIIYVLVSAIDAKHAGKGDV